MTTAPLYTALLRSFTPLLLPMALCLTAGCKTANKFRQGYLKDWAERMEWLRD